MRKSTREQVKQERRERLMWLLILLSIIFALAAQIATVARAKNDEPAKVAPVTTTVRIRAEQACFEELPANKPPVALTYERPWNVIESCRVTAYCPCRKCCGKDPGHPAYGITSSGTTATQGRTVAVDTSVIPYGSEVEIEGEIYIAEDTGVYGGWIDLYFDDHHDALQWGDRCLTVRWRAP